MTLPTTTPSIRELVAEFAVVEDRIRVAEARVHGGSAPPHDPELMRLTRRESEILALLRSHNGADATPA